MNEAAILAARRSLTEISKEEIADALERIIAGECLAHSKHGSPLPEGRRVLVRECMACSAALRWLPLPAPFHLRIPLPH